MSEPKYIIGFETELGTISTIYGPTTLSDTLTFWPTDFLKDPFVYEVGPNIHGANKKSNFTKRFKFNQRRQEWERIDRVKPFVDPMVGDRYEVILRSKQELIETLGQKELNLQERFFGEKPDLTSDEDCQFVCVYHNSILARVYYDRMRIHDGDKLRRDLQWVKYHAEEAYKWGYWDGMGAQLSKPMPKATSDNKPVQSELPLGGGTNKTIKRVK